MPDSIQSFSVTTTTEVTPNPSDTGKCGGGMCDACLILSSSWFCTLFRETVMGQRRVARCIKAQETVTV